MTFTIIQIPRDEGNIRRWAGQFKTFRLLSLRTAPEAFGSTYAREVAFSDNVWYNRMANPKATTFIALQEERVVCTLVAIGPLPCIPEESSPTGDPWLPPVEQNLSTNQLHFRFNGMFTLPEARGQGIAMAILKRAIDTGLNQAATSSSTYTASVVVDADNPPAIALYQRCGFVEIGREYMPGTSRLVILLKWKPDSSHEEVEATTI